MFYVYVYGAPVEKGFVKALCKRGFAMGALWRPCIQRDSQSTCRAELCKAPRGFVHTCIHTHISVFIPTDMG